MQKRNAGRAVIKTQRLRDLASASQPPDPLALLTMAMLGSQAWQSLTGVDRTVARRSTTKRGPLRQFARDRRKTPRSCD
jgi:hypothetical protein